MRLEPHRETSYFTSPPSLSEREATRSDRNAWLNGKTVGGQSKNTEDLTLAMVLAEVAEARSFPGGLAEFYVVTSGERDAPLQNAVRQHFKAAPAPFDVEVVFWSDVTADLAQDETLVAKHWKGFSGASIPSERDRIGDQFSLIRLEAQRMKEHAEVLNRGLYNGSWQQYLPQKFRPTALNDAYTKIASSFSAQQAVLLSSLTTLQGAAAAADSEAERVLDGRVFDLEELRRLVLLAGNNAHHVVREIDQMLARQQ